VIVRELAYVIEHWEIHSWLTDKTYSLRQWQSVDHCDTPDVVPATIKAQSGHSHDGTNSSVYLNEFAGADFILLSLYVLWTARTTSAFASRGFRWVLRRAQCLRKKLLNAFQVFDLM